MLNVLDIFSGIGGFSHGLHRTGGFRTVAFCEIAPYPRRLLAKHWPGARCYSDISELSAYHLRRDGIAIDVICGGFPCQAFSTAARGRNTATDLWPEYMRLVSEVRPAWVVAENVPGIGVGGIDRVCSDLEAADYTAVPFDLDTSLPERQRERRRIIWLAHSNSHRQPRRAEHAEMASLCAVSRRSRADISAPVGMDDGFPNRMDRLGCLGNALTPIAAEALGYAILSMQH